MTFLCISSYYKGRDFLIALHEAGHRVLFVTSTNLKSANWPHESIDQIFYMDEDEHGNWNMDHFVEGLAFQMRSTAIDRVIALDDFDVEKAAYIREEFRIDGMGLSTSRKFRDKLAMRICAESAGIRVPNFTGLFNDDSINAYLDSTAAPHVIKPRSEASATGIKKVHSKEEAWEVIHSLGDQRHRYLIEQFRPGDVYHTDALYYDSKMCFCSVSKYQDPPFDVAHGGGIFQSALVDHGGKEDKALQKMTTSVLSGFGLVYGASHTEFIRCHEDGEYYFLETSSRVGGANIAEMVDAATNINLWHEWAKIEATSVTGGSYKLPKPRKAYAGVIISLAKTEHPDHHDFPETEIVWRLNKPYHIGMICAAESRTRILELLDVFAGRIQRDFHASAPAPDRSMN